MNEVQEIEWEECCICDSEEKGDLRSTAKGIVTLAGWVLEFWKNGLLPFDPANITTNYFVGATGTDHPDFKHVMLRKSAEYHHNCHIRYSPCNLTRKEKSLQSKNKKAEVGQSSAFLHSAMGSNTCVSSSPVNPNHIYIICYEDDAFENLLAAETFHVSKSKLNTEHVMKVTNNWRDSCCFYW